MRSLGHRVQLGLLLAAIFAPNVVLAVLGIRVARQERELQSSRREEDQRRLVAQTSDRLRAVLETIRADEIRVELEPGHKYNRPETVLVGWSEDGQLVLPWDPERDPAVRRSREMISQGVFGSTMRMCEASALDTRGAAGAAGCFKRAEAIARNQVQVLFARWQEAVALEDAGETQRAAALAEPLLDSRLDITDADGVPLRLHASRSLLRAGMRSPRVVAALDSVLSSRPWLSNMSMTVLMEIARSASREVDQKRAALRKLMDQADLLESDFPRVKAALKDSWISFGDDLWLIGAAGDVDHSAVIFVVRGTELIRRNDIPGAIRLADAMDRDGEFLGPPFPGLKVVLRPAASNEGAGMETSFLFLALSVTVVVTIFAAYLLWRDLRREMQVSDLRAQFVSSVSHELKTPLTAIRMFAETLQMGRFKDEAVQAEYLGTIVNECERLTRLVDGVLLFSKADQGKKIYHFRPIQLAQAVDAAARAMEYPLAEHGFRLHSDIREGMPPVSADRDAIEQAVLNLLSNAMKFSGDSRDIELSVVREGEEAIIRVTDHGIGIAPEEQPRIFDKFYRARTRENQLIPGTGLGLALVAQIAQAHGGRVTVDSELGKGSTFCLRLPTRDGAGPAKGSSI